jgi:uncharacterized protein YaaN involved in tellurite resistance
MHVHDPEFDNRIREINELASKQIVEASAGPTRMLDRGTSVAATRKNGRNDPTASVVSALADLRSTVEDLTPNAADLTGTQKILGFIPGGKKVMKYFQRYESSQGQLNNIVKSLIAGAEELEKDNADLQLERINLRKVMQELSEYSVLASKIDAELVAQIDAAKRAGDLETANELDTKALFAIRQRRQDILTQLAVSAQGYLAMGLVQNNNVELIKGVKRARTTTLTALRTAIILAKALTNQELVLNQIDAVNKATNNAILQSSEMLKKNTARIHEQAVNSGVSVETLEKAFTNIFETIDEVQNFKTQANIAMETTIGGLEAQLNRAAPQLEKARKLELEQGNK